MPQNATKNKNKQEWYGGKYVQQWKLVKRHVVILFVSFFRIFLQIFYFVKVSSSILDSNIYARIFIMIFCWVKAQARLDCVFLRVEMNETGQGAFCTMFFIVDF